MARNPKYYLKDKKIMLVRKQSYRDPIGQYIEGYVYMTKVPIWCYAKQLTQNQTFEAKTYGESETRFFVINNRKDIKLYDFIEYRGKYYTITRVDTDNDYNGDMYIYAFDTPPGDTPEDIQPLVD